MDSNQIPPVQPVSGSMPPMGGGFGTPGVSGGLGGSGASGGPRMAPSGMPMVQQIKAPVVPKKDATKVVLIIAVVMLTLVAATFIVLFLMKYKDYETLEADWTAETKMAVVEATDKQAMELVQRYNEQMKYPYLPFAGPADYGQLQFEYPRNWSVYIEKAATNGGDFSAYLNPGQVDPVSSDTLNALRVTISSRGFDEVTQEYQRIVDQKNSGLSVKSVQIGNSAKGTSATANRYDGVIPGTEFQGSIVIFKIRDKTVILQTDSEQFTGTDDQNNLRDFEKILSSITFNA